MLGVAALALTGNATGVWAADPGHGGQKVHTAKPNSDANGNSLPEWFADYCRWIITGEPSSGESGNVVFMPLPQGVQGPSIGGVVHLVGHQDKTIKTGQSFFVTAAFINGERYEDGSVDPVFGPAAFDAVAVTLDGAPVMEPIANFFVPAQYFNPELVYDQPSGYHSVSTLYVTGYGFLSRPLTPGVHTMTIRGDFTSLFNITFDNTFTITVIAGK